MAFVNTDLEARSFRRAARAAATERRPRKPLQTAVRAEMLVLNRQLDRFCEIEAAIRLRALSELEANLSTDTLCGLAASAV